MFPDKAIVYVAAIEDEEYKNSKIECECRRPPIGAVLLFLVLDGTLCYLVVICVAHLNLAHQPGGGSYH